MNKFVIISEIINTFTRPVFGILYDYLGYKKSLFCFNILNFTIILLMIFSLNNVYFFGILNGLS